MGQHVHAAAIYARISSDQDRTALGVGRQLEDCRRLADRLGWAVADEYVDNHVSAYSGKTRPEFERLIEDLESGVVDGVLCYDEDRLARRLVDSERFVETLRLAGNRPLHFVTGGSLDLTNGDGLMFMRLKTTFAANESDTKSRRVRRKMEELAAAGRIHGGGVRPFGYERDRLTVRADEAEIIRQLAERFLAGETLISLTRWLNDEGVPTSGKATEWRTSSVRNVLRSARISGQREHRGEIVGPGEWPAIIPPEMTARLRAKLDDPNRRTNRSARRYALAGMLRCGRCGATLFAHPRQGVRRYHCKS